MNEKVNVPRTFIREIRAMLHNLQKAGVTECQLKYETKFRPRRHRSPDSAIPPFLWVLRGKISYVGMIRGTEDVLYRKLLKRLDELAPGLVKVPVLKDEIERLFEHIWIIEADADEKRQGTAFMLRDVGLVTASHVLGKGKIKRIQIKSVDGQARYEASVSKRDGTLDLAVLEVTGLTKRLAWRRVTSRSKDECPLR